ncbi:non-ribosomal peptide synthetase [Microbulbifer taiwanensis]|uniref:non-ribosomal peptide synthetase n=1 Tax=Microbulbifer taiwanensis TaxID=986746 RepID=UPI001867FD5C|nr:non-ribosomal peptide synthetase [Microbulbifer taiwanensis]
MDMKTEAQTDFSAAAEPGDFHDLRNIVDHLRSLAATRPRDIALVVAAERDGVAVDTPVTYAELDARARALAARLQRNFAPQDRALLLLDNDDHYAVAFFACLYAGLIAVPVFPPESARRQHIARLSGIADDAGARCILTSGDLLALVGPAMAAFGDADIIAVDRVDTADADQWSTHSPGGEQIAFLQYTSGSTSAPKGVMVSHDNLIANERAMARAMATSADDVFVSWLPLFHDMGLIGGLLQPIYRGGKLVLMSPQFFLQRPARWLEAISRHRGTVSGGPDFAYRLCVDRLKEAQIARLDLSSWRVAFSGAEPVRHQTLDAFISRFSAAGFAASAANPCYGLAEATLMVSASEPGSGMGTVNFDERSLQQGKALPDANGQTLVACGRVVEDHLVSIRDRSSGEACADGTLGEIWAGGPSIAQGYWNSPAQTAETFVERDGGRWLKTGDLGFIHRDQLYVAGRVKDLIIVRGHNLYPQDIESAVEARVSSVRRGRVAAFAVAGPDGEGIGLAAEVSRGVQKRESVQALVQALGEAVSETCGEPLTVAVLLNPGGLPKTSSGKLQRSSCRQGWEGKSLDAFGIYEFGKFALGGEASADGDRPRDREEIALAEIWAGCLGFTDSAAVRRDTHFFAAGGSSLTAVQVAAAIEARWQIAFSPRALFECPRLGDCAAEIRRRSGGAAAEAVRIPARDSGGQSQPLSPAQLRQWFLWKLDPSGSAYHIRGALHLAGALDADAMAEAVSVLGGRHPSLRTEFIEGEDGEVRQRARSGAGPALQFVDLCGAADAEARAGELLHQLDGEAFDLCRGPLARMLLIRLDGDAHILALVMHHIVSDGVSTQILLDELALCYRAALDRAEPALPPVDLEYTDYAHWQREWQGSDTRERQLDYWRTQLGSEHPPLLLPVDHARRSSAASSGEGGYRAARHHFLIPDSLQAGLRRLAESTDTTLFMALLAALQALLHRHSGEGDIRVGVPVANRPRPELRQLVGLFVNTLVLRSRIDGRTSLQQLLAQVRESALGAQENQDLPFDQLVEALRPERSAARNPLFQVMFNHLREDRGAFSRHTGLAATDWQMPAGDAQFELALDTREGADGHLSVTFTYAAELFEPATIARLADHYLLLLGALSAQPQAALGDIDLLGEAGRRQLREWGRGEARCADVQPVQRLVERQARQTPDAVAVEFGSEQWSYDQLNRRANRLAHQLIELGVGPEVRVGIAAQRSLEMVLGLLAILKAGGAYVPLEPEYPLERLTRMIEGSGIELLLTQSHLVAQMPEREGLQLLALDTLDLGGAPDGNPQVALHGENLAYVIYTSGSTGEPKGAANRHSALHNRLQWMQDAYALDGADRVLQKTPFSFDVSVWEFFWPLVTGARLVMARPGEHREPARLVELIRERGITTVHFVPSMLQAFLEESGVESCGSLRHIVCSGEALPAQAQEAVFARLPRAALHNLYGPTEAAIDVTHWTCRRGAAGTPPIGRPIAGLETWVLDADLNPVLPGVTGELYLGGAGLARGYLGRADLTAERFVAAPGAGVGERLYRTGDLVRWNGDGQLEYLGRVDHQVKIRGLRIELGEIEAQLLAQAPVREAAVVAAGERLLAYVSTRSGQAIDSAQLLARLGEQLPDYMVPAALLELEALPLNANGKLDRKALPPIEPVRRAAAEAPQGETELALAALWQQLLGAGPVGRQDHFFELGGHSLLAAMLASRVRQSMGRELALRNIFEYPTLQRQAEHLQTLVPLAPGDEPPLAPLERGATVPLAPAQQRLWLVERMAAAGQAPAYNMAGALRLHGGLDLSILRAALDTLVARHQALRTVYPEDDEGNPVAVIRDAAPVALPVADLSGALKGDLFARGGAQADAVERALAEEAARPFDLARGPLLRCRLLRFGPERHALLLCVHHIAFDGWSEGVFAREFATIYRDLSGGAAPALPALAVQYADYALWQRRRLEASAGRDAHFWRDYLDGAPALSTLPPELPEDTAGAGGGAAPEVDIPGGAGAAPPRLGRAKDSSEFTLLLAAFSALLHRRAGADDLVIGTDLAGRDHPHLEDLIGFFVNVVPLRSHLQPGLSFAQWLDRTRESSLAAFDYRHVPFDQIVEHAGAPRSRGSNPLVQVLFVMQNTPRSHFEIPGLSIELVPAAVATSKFDLAVFVRGDAGGFRAPWVYATARYRRETIGRVAEDWYQLLLRVAAEPEAPLEQLLPAAVQPPPSGAPASPGDKTGKGGRSAKLDKLRRIAGGGVCEAAAAPAQIATSFLQPGREFPLVVEAGGPDIDAVAWAGQQRAFIETALRRHAGILFRNFGLETPQQFEAFAEAMEPGLHGSYGDLPKKKGGRNIYRSTPYPERQMILYHNESSHLERWPRKQWFFCELPSRVGGATPIVDCREMLRRLPPPLVEEFARRELLYVRTFLPGLDVSWQDFFKTDSRAEVEARLAAAGTDWRWLDERTLQTRSRCPAVIVHPLTGERVFFNQVQLHHVSCLLPEVREDLLDLVGAERMPRQVYFGDGGAIDDETMAVIGRAYEDCAVRFDWRRGDVVMLDNMLAAHARDPYEEPRRIVVAMGDMVEREMLAGTRPAARKDKEKSVEV